MFFKWLSKYFGKNEAVPEVDTSKWGMWLKYIDFDKSICIEKNPDTLTEVKKTLHSVYVKILTKSPYVRLVKEHEYEDFIANSFAVVTFPKVEFHFSESKFLQIKLEEYEVITDQKLIDKLECLANKAIIEKQNKEKQKEILKQKFKEEVIALTLKQKC